METEKIIAGITHGDINGIGYEVILKTFAEPRILEIITPVIYGSSKAAAYYRKLLDIQGISFNQVSSVKDIHHKKINIINCTDDEIKVEPGRVTEEAGKAAFLALEKATDDLKAGLLHVLITAPINKKNIQSDAFHFPGHTEYLSEKAGENKTPLMLLINDVMRVAVVTGHIPVSKISGTITSELILEKLKVLNQTLKTDFKIIKPRIAVLGLNPHAGDDGVIGNEETDVIKPALKEAEKIGICCFGPYPADGFFGSGHFSRFDAVLAMYHDQGLAPFKTVSMDSGVNFTAGLPFIRTSPAHGTGYDIAGKNIATEDSFRQAIYAAYDIYNNRKLYAEISANPLKVELRTERSGRPE